MVWKTAINNKRKNQIVVDIYKLNNLIISNAYFLLLQSEIITNIQEYTNLAILNTASFSTSVYYTLTIVISSQLLPTENKRSFRSQSWAT